MRSRRGSHVVELLNGTSRNVDPSSPSASLTAAPCWPRERLVSLSLVSHPAVGAGGHWRGVLNHDRMGCRHRGGCGWAAAGGRRRGSPARKAATEMVIRIRRRRGVGYADGGYAGGLSRHIGARPLRTIAPERDRPQCAVVREAPGLRRRCDGRSCQTAPGWHDRKARCRRRARRGSPAMDPMHVAIAEINDVDRIIPSLPVNASLDVLRFAIRAPKIVWRRLRHKGRLWARGAIRRGSILDGRIRNGLSGLPRLRGLGELRKLGGDRRKGRVDLIFDRRHVWQMRQRHQGAETSRRKKNERLHKSKMIKSGWISPFWRYQVKNTSIGRYREFPQCEDRHQGAPPSPKHGRLKP